MKKNIFGYSRNGIREYLRRLVQIRLHSYLLHSFVGSISCTSFVSVDINTEEYETTRDFWTICLFVSQRPSHSKPTNTKLLWLSESNQQQLKDNLNILWAWCWTIAVLITLLCLVLFDIALPKLTINIEGDGRTHTQLRAQNIGISAPGLDYKHVLTWFWAPAPTVDVMLSYDIVVKSEGIRITCNGVQSVHKVDLSQLLRHIHDLKLARVQTDEVCGPDSNKLSSIEHSVTDQHIVPILNAHALELKDIGIQLDPTLITASLYILAKDVLLAVSRTGTPEGNSVRGATNCNFVSVLINVRRFAFTVHNIVPSEGYELVLRSCVYKRLPGAKASSGRTRNDAKKASYTLDDGACVDHSFCLNELTVHSCSTAASICSEYPGIPSTPDKMYDTDIHTRGPTGPASARSNSIGIGVKSQIKELLLQVNGATGYCTSSSNSSNIQPVQDMHLSLDFLYVKPAAAPKHTCNGQTADDTCMVTAHGPDAAVSAALIVYSKFTSLFAHAY